MGPNGQAAMSHRAGLVLGVYSGGGCVFDPAFPERMTSDTELPYMAQIAREVDRGYQKFIERRGLEDSPAWNTRQRHFGSGKVGKRFARKKYTKKKP